MDYYRALQELRDEARRLDAAIDTLQRLIRGEDARPHSTRGRKSMSEEERLAVSARMKDYWAARRSTTNSATS